MGFEVEGKRMISAKGFRGQGNIGEELAAAWEARAASGILDELETLRVFHGAGEGTGALSQLAIDRFGAHFWVTEWATEDGPGPAQALLPEIADFLRARGAASAVALMRPEKGVPGEPQILFGEPPAPRFEVRESGARFWIQLLGTRHPGLFLDHLPLRQWLRHRMKGRAVLNTFAYTGSLSVVCGLGGARHVTTLDLSNPTIQWATDNWKLNELAMDRARFIAGDCFEWLPRLKREGQRFDCVILDPPSFSRSKKGSFSTAKDLRKLHSQAMTLLAPHGVLVTSINSANVSREKYAEEVLAAAREQGLSFRVIAEIQQPETFPTRLDQPRSRYLKGWILQS